ncbi:glycosyltransferase [Pseudonocardia charpentierae]|uniref:Glycosyltransferase family A protein n=1 Tax=Pseudonocardia charpentierae TaxID=3075545 RepID=A0ABU2NIH5_9PSEU|nr:glycosyltransferase family A protein [Pseudonocardia sp. DSM 45834]MDT0353775.1 glycosyltransferase family A protein [Pseudonocardia sp. DSM 45834]
MTEATSPPGQTGHSWPPSVSVVIPAYNAAATLAEQLEALAGQDYEGDWEVVVVDNGSNDATADIARHYAQRLPTCRVVEGRRRGHAAPRNDGARAARGELLAYCDADDVVAPGWLRAIAAAACRYDLVGGWLDPEPLNDEATRSWHGAYPRDGLRSWLLPYSGAGNFAIWAEVLCDLGGWSDDYEAGAEDVELCWRAQLAGYRLGFAPDAVVQVRYRPGLRSSARKAWTIGINSERLLRDFGFLRELDLPAKAEAVHAVDDGTGALGRALGRGVWLVTRLHYLLGSRRRRGQWISVGAQYAGRLRGALEYRVRDRLPRGPARATTGKVAG